MTAKTGQKRRFGCLEDSPAPEDSSLINASSRFALSGSGVGSGIALAAHDPAFQVFAVVVDGASETQEGWRIMTARDALLREFAGWEAVFSLNLGRSQEAFFHGALVVVDGTQTASRGPAQQIDDWSVDLGCRGRAKTL